MSESSSDDAADENENTLTAETASEPPSQAPSTSSSSKVQSAVASLSSILTSLPPSLLSSQSPASSLLRDPNVSDQITALLRHPDSGAGDNNLCRWFYDTFQSSEPQLQLLVLRFLPTIAGLYLCRVTRRKPLAGFEAILLALYAHETTSRSGQSVTINVPDLSHPSIYHESKEPNKNNATELNLAVISPSLEPHGTVRSTKRARIVGVALELYYSKISQIPVESKIDFCEFVESWSGEDGEMYKEGGEEDGERKREKKKEGQEGCRIPLPWELLQPVLRILGHCLLGAKGEKGVFDAACLACRSLYARCLHDMNAKAILATTSLLRLSKTLSHPNNHVDHTEIKITNIISI